MDGSQTHRNLKRILHWCLQEQQQESSTEGRRNFDSERQRWLLDALESISNEPTETDLLKAALAVLHTQYSTCNSVGYEKLIEAFDQVEYFVEDLDHASDLIPLNGVSIIMKYLHHSESSLQIKACSVIASATQNHPRCQQVFIPSLQTLVEISTNVENSDELQTKSVYALSSIVRGYEPAVQELLRINGITAILGCLHSSNTKLVTKVCFLLQALYQEPNDELKAIGCDVMRKLASLISQSTDVGIKSMCITALYSIVTQCKMTSLSQLSDKCHFLHTTVTELEDEVMFV